jgi:hypothetical protein
MMLSGEFGEHNVIKISRKTEGDKPAENLFFEAVDGPKEPKPDKPDKAEKKGKGGGDKPEAAAAGSP